MSLSIENNVANFKDTWELGPIYLTPPIRDVSLGMHFKTPRNPAMTTTGDTLPKGSYFLASRKQYETSSTSDFIRVKAYAKGNTSRKEIRTLPVGLR